MNAFKLASTIVAFGAIATISACTKGDTTVKSVDTTVVSTKVKDTTIVKADTTVHVDTVKQTHNVKP